MMRIHNFHFARVILQLTLFMISLMIFTEEAFAAPVMLLSRLEQAERVSGLFSQALGRTLVTQTGESISQAPYFQRDYRNSWISASSYERVRLAERIGNQGRARFATESGWIKLIGSQARGIVQGPDAVYWDPRNGILRVLEAKGGSSPVKNTYGAWQGTNRNAIRSAEGALKKFNNTTTLEKLANARVIKAAQSNRLHTCVVRTKHVLGTPNNPQVEGLWSNENVAMEAVEIEQRLTRQYPEAASIFKAADMAQSSDVFKFSAEQSFDILQYRAAQGIVMLGLAGSGLIGWDAYQQSKTAYEMWNDPVVGRTTLPCLQTGFAVGKWAESGTLGLGSAAQLGLLGTSGLSVIGRTASKGFLPIAIFVEGMCASVAYNDYSAGRISKREFLKRSTGPLILGVFATGGAIIGGVAGGTLSGGVGAGPGAFMGANLAGLVAIPVQIVADWGWNYYYSKFDEKQRAAVDLALKQHYGLLGQ